MRIRFDNKKELRKTKNLIKEIIKKSKGIDLFIENIERKGFEDNSIGIEAIVLISPAHDYVVKIDCCDGFLLDQNLCERFVPLHYVGKIENSCIYLQRKIRFPWRDVQYLPKVFRNYYLNGEYDLHCENVGKLGRCNVIIDC